MAGYSPIRIAGFKTGLVQDREEFILPNDAYPILQNAYVWRERILRKLGYQLLGRLQRNFPSLGFLNSQPSPFTFNILTISGFVIAADNGNPGIITTKSPHNLQNGDIVVISNIVGAVGYNDIPFVITVIDSTHFSVGVDAGGFGVYTNGGQWLSNRSLLTIEPTASIVPGSVIYTIFAASTRVFTDDGLGHLLLSSTQFGTINYVTGDVTITTSAGAPRRTALQYSYYPGLPVMGIRTRELQNSANDQTIVFDQKYAYDYNTGLASFEEFPPANPGTTWNLHNGSVSATDFFWSTNYWVSSTIFPGTLDPLFTTNNVKLFWETNNTGQFGALADPIRITDGVTWVDFKPPDFGQIDAVNFLVNCLSFLPFRGRLVAFNTWEGPDFPNAENFSNRIRWSTIGNPFIKFSDVAPAKGSWRDDIRGQGGFLDIPTSEDIVSVGFVRDNLVIYCERSTWQLRYTGRAIAPFQIERVNSELGGMGPFSAVQFDTSLVGIGDKGIVECDSYQSQRIDIKIPDFVFKFQSTNNGDFRVHGVRDFINRLAYWTVPLDSDWVNSAGTTPIFPTQRLVYNYENGSWALFNDSLTTLGTYQPQSSRTWLNTHAPWVRCNFPWRDNNPAESPQIIGGNQQGFIEYLDQLTTNDVSLFIQDITPNTDTPTVITSPNHNMNDDFIIGISGIPAGSPYSNLNDGIFGIIVTSSSEFKLTKYDFELGKFVDQLDVPAGAYIGGGLINIRENFTIQSKKFNFLDEGQAIQIGYVDVLMVSTDKQTPGEITLNVYLDYNDLESSNTLPRNAVNNGIDPPIPDTFFNSTIPTAESNLASIGGTKFWQRVFCATRASFITLQYTLSDVQMVSIPQEQVVQIDAQIIWARKAGRLNYIG